MRQQKIKYLNIFEFFCLKKLSHNNIKGSDRLTESLYCSGFVIYFIGLNSLINILILITFCLIVLLLSCLLLVRLFLVIITVDGTSMIPTFYPGDRVLIFRRFPVRLLRKEQIAILDLSKADLIPDPKPVIVIKRLIGLQGDIIRIHTSQVNQGVPFINMSILSDDGYYQMRVPPKHCFVQADGKGSDSRHWGAIPLCALVGIVIKRM
jgi:signal peptidase I